MLETGLHETGCILGRIRRHKGISISDLCRLSGVSRKTVVLSEKQPAGSRLYNRRLYNRRDWRWQQHTSTY